MSLYQISKKVKHCVNRHWYGQMTPSQFLFLVKELNLNVEKYRLDRIKKLKKEGKSGLVNISFQMNEKQKLKLFGRKS